MKTIKVLLIAAAAFFMVDTAKAQVSVSIGAHFGTPAPRMVVVDRGYYRRPVYVRHYRPAYVRPGYGYYRRPAYVRHGGYYRRPAIIHHRGPVAYSRGPMVYRGHGGRHFRR